MITTNNTRVLLLFLVTLFFIFSCENSDNKIYTEKNTNFASKVISNANIIYKDSGLVKMNIKAAKILEYGFVDTTYTIFPKGVDVQMFDKQNKRSNKFNANWAKMINIKGIFEGKGKVKMVNDIGDTLKTNYIVWNKAKKRIFTKDTVIIIRADNTFNISNGGIDAKDDFKEYTLYGNSGELYLKK